MDHGGEVRRMNTCVYNTRDKLRFGRRIEKHMSGTAKNDAEKKNRLTTVIIIVLAIVVVALVAVVAFLLGRGGKPTAGEESSTPRREVTGSARMVLSEESAQSVVDEMRQEVEEGMFECNMSFEWTFEDGETESKDAYVANSTNNKHPIYFDVIIEDTNEVVYSSPVIPVGSQLTDFKLDKPLSAGSYRAICQYVLLDDEESQTEISRANFIIKITVKN
jgi:hypothetical protein